MELTAPAPARPAYRRPGYLALVAVGGALGTALRAWLETTFAVPAGTWPWPTFWINVTGSFALGALVTGLARGGPDAGRRRSVRVGVGTGVIGGYTTYSTFIVEVDRLLRAGHPIGVAYALVSVVVGVGAALLGVLGARRVVR